MMFRFKLDMKGRHGAPISFMIGEVNVASIDEMATLLNDDRFIIVEQKSEGRDGELNDIGPIVINRRQVINVREFKERQKEEAHD